MTTVNRSQYEQPSPIVESSLQYLRQDIYALCLLTSSSLITLFQMTQSNYPMRKKRMLTRTPAMRSTQSDITDCDKKNIYILLPSVIQPIRMTQNGCGFKGSLHRNVFFFFLVLGGS